MEYAAGNIIKLRALVYNVSDGAIDSRRRVWSFWYRWPAEWVAKSANLGCRQSGG